MKSLQNDLKDKVIIVTGGTQGVGEGICTMASERGAKVVFCGRSASNGKKLENTLKSKNQEALFVHADLSKSEDTEKVANACLEAFGRIDGLVNAAGSTERATLEDTTATFFDEMFAINVKAPVLLTKHVVKAMKKYKHAGSIVNILSVESHGGQPKLMAYAASKAALANITRNNAYAFRYDNIRVNGINLGWTETPNEHKVQLSDGEPENWQELANKRLPFGRLNRPSDVAELSLFLLSHRAEMITGALIDMSQLIPGCYGTH